MSKQQPSQFRYLYGPVPSRRLGLSLGVDVVPLKTCTLNCVYCQLGRTTKKKVEPAEFVDVETVLTELKQWLAKGKRADFITIAGSGEPTLYSQLGDLIDGIHKLTDIPVAILTNGTLLYRPDVRAACTKADVVLPSLDAGDEQLFERINRPHHDISIEKLVSGLSQFRKEFSGKLWLEVFLIEGLNTQSQQISTIRNLVARVNPDKVHLNTAVRPPAERHAKPVDPRTMQTIAKEFGKQCEVIADFPAGYRARSEAVRQTDVLSMLKRRPCSIDDISQGLGISLEEASSYINLLQKKRLIKPERRGQVTFFKAAGIQK